MKRVFSLNLLVDRAKLAVNERSSDYLATANTIEKLLLNNFPVTLAFQFKIVDEEYI